MSQEGIEKLIGRALSDLKFFESFLQDPEGAVKKEGLNISPEELALIKNVDKSKAKQFAENFSREFAGRQQLI